MYYWFIHNNECYYQTIWSRPGSYDDRPFAIVCATSYIRYAIWRHNISDDLFQALLSRKLTKADWMELTLFDRSILPLIKSYTKPKTIVDIISITKMRIINSNLLPWMSSCK
jgi:hypothetical protein